MSNNSRATGQCVRDRLPHIIHFTRCYSQHTRPSRLSHTARSVKQYIYSLFLLSPSNQKLPFTVVEQLIFDNSTLAPKQEHITHVREHLTRPQSSSYSAQGERRERRVPAPFPRAPLFLFRVLYEDDWGRVSKSTVHFLISSL